MQKIPFSNPFLLAPMAGITDMPFRRLMKRLGVGGVISEFVSVHAISRKDNPRTAKYLAYHEEERPVGIQIFGDTPELLAGAAKIIQDKGLDFIDINLGCPVPKVTRKLSGSAWLCRPVELGQMLKTVRAAVSIPFTIKIRTGWDADSINTSEIVRIAENEGVDMVSIHGRTRAQGYAGLADWAEISRVAQTAKIPIIGNGDILSGPMAVARLIDSGCSGVMIGRGALKNPWIFQEAVEALRQYQALPEEDRRPYLDAVYEHHKIPDFRDLNAGEYYYTKKVKRLQPLPVDQTANWIRIRADRDPLWLLKTHMELLREMYPEDRVKFNVRKFLAWYAAGYPGAKEFRKFIFTHDDFAMVLDKSVEFFENVKALGVQGDEHRENDPLFSTGHG